MTLELAWFATRISQKHVIFLQSTGLNIKVLLDYIEMKGKMKIKIVHMISKFSYTIMLFFHAFLNGDCSMQYIQLILQLISLGNKFCDNL